MVFQNGEIVLVRRNNNALGNLSRATIVSSATRELAGVERLHDAGNVETHLVRFSIGFFLPPFLLSMKMNDSLFIFLKKCCCRVSACTPLTRPFGARLRL